MSVNTRKLIPLFVLAALAAGSWPLHLLPSVVEHFHQSDPREAQRISHFLTQSDARGSLLPRSRAAARPADPGFRHKISASLLNLREIGGPGVPGRRLRAGAGARDRAAGAVKKSGSPRRGHSLAGKPVFSGEARQRMMAGERKLLFAATDERGETINMTFETTEIKDALDFIEFKISELNTLMTECINRQFQSEVISNVNAVKAECVGMTFQVLYYNYREGMAKVKDILMELLKIKLQTLKEDYEDETNFFLDIIENLIDKDFDVFQSLDIAKKAAKYYVSPRYFERLVELARPELEAFTKIHLRLKTARNTIQKLLSDLQQEDEEYLDQLESQADELDAGEDSAAQQSMQQLLSQPAPSQSFGLESSAAQTSPDFGSQLDQSGHEEQAIAQSDLDDENLSDDQDHADEANDESLDGEEHAGEEGGETAGHESGEGQAGGQEGGAAGEEPAPAGASEEGRRLFNNRFNQPLFPETYQSPGFSRLGGFGLNSQAPAFYPGLDAQSGAFGGFADRSLAGQPAFQAMGGFPQAGPGPAGGYQGNYQGVGNPAASYPNFGLRKALL